jgi:hypothetical protein
MKWAGTPDEMKADFLASDEVTYIAGQTLFIETFEKYGQHRCIH